MNVKISSRRRLNIQQRKKMQSY